MDAVKKRHWWQSPQLTWSVIGLLCLLVGYLVVLMYARGEYLFAIMTLILSSVGLYIFANRKAYASALCLSRPRRHGPVCPVSADLHYRYRVYQLQ